MLFILMMEEWMWVRGVGFVEGGKAEVGDVVLETEGEGDGGGGGGRWNMCEGW